MKSDFLGPESFSQPDPIQLYLLQPSSGGKASTSKLVLANPQRLGKEIFVLVW